MKNTITDAIGGIEDRFIAEAMDYKCERGQIVMTIKKIAVIAAAVMVILTVTVSAAAFTGLVGKDKALGAAMDYVVQNAETAEEKDILTAYIYAGVAEIEMFEEQYVNLGLKDFRAVYSVGFRLGEYYYAVGVDAKTGVVISCEREVNEEWWRNRQSEDANVRPAEDYGDYFDELEKFQEGIYPNDLLFIAKEYTGLYTIPQGRYSTDICKSYDVNILGNWRGVDTEVMRKIYGVEAEDFPEIYDKYRTWFYEIAHGGYKYSLYIDSVTGEVLNCDITEYDEYEGERHLHEPLEGYIGPYQAWNTFKAETGIDYDSIMDWHSYGSSFIPEGGVILYEGGSSENTYGKDIYYTSVTMKYAAGGETTVCIIDAKTGEIIETYNYTDDPARAVSTEAPEGMISEAEALIIVLEDLGVTDRYIEDFTVELEESEIPNESCYEINITVFNDVSYIYKVNAVSGKISDKSKR